MIWVPAGAAVTVTSKVVVASDGPSAVPRTVRVYVPVAMDAPASSVRVTMSPVVDAGDGVTVSPVGTSSTVTVTSPLKPPSREMVTSRVPDAPCSSVMSETDPREMDPDGASVTVSDQVASSETPEPAAVTVPE